MANGTTLGSAPRLSEVARLANVSTATASRALRKPEVVAPVTRSRVDRAVRHLGYESMAAARDLRRGRQGRIGVLLAADSDPEEIDVASSCVAAIRGGDRAAALHRIPARGFRRTEVLGDLGRLRSLDGLIDVNARLTPEELRLLGHSPASVVAAADVPTDLDYLLGRRLTAIPVFRSAGIVVALTAPTARALARLSGLSSLAPNTVAIWHDGTIGGARDVLACDLAEREQGDTRPGLLYVALDAIAGGGAALALARRTRDVVELVCVGAHPIADALGALSVRTPAVASGTLLVDRLFATIDARG